MAESHHISSAVVVTRPTVMESVAAKLSALNGVEVHAISSGKIVLVIEGPHSGHLGETLIRISAMDDVIAAHMVFEQVLEELRDDERTDAP